LTKEMSCQDELERISRECPIISCRGGTTRNRVLFSLPTISITSGSGRSAQNSTLYLFTPYCSSESEKSDGRIVVVSSLGYKMGLKSIQFEDLNFEKNYSPRNAYNQSELALMMFIYELQRRIRAENKNVQAFVCHPGASRTSLIDTSGSRFDRFVWSIISKTIAQSAEKGAWPEVMCATEDGLRQVAFYGPTKRGETVGPVGEGMLDPIALDKEAATRLWKISEEMTALSWPL
jgi:NAD(P)-dependent dehydrogenase (short-subunit alcohol dehydrogenase family)